MNTMNTKSLCITLVVGIAVGILTTLVAYVVPRGGWTMALIIVIILTAGITGRYLGRPAISPLVGFGLGYAGISCYFYGFDLGVDVSFIPAFATALGGVIGIAMHRPPAKPNPKPTKPPNWISGNIATTWQQRQNEWEASFPFRN